MTTEFENAAQQLFDLLEQENDALRRTDFSSAVALLPAKDIALTNLMKQPVTPALPLIAATLMRQVAALAAENQTLLERALVVQTRIIRIVARAGAQPTRVMQYNGHGGQIPLTRTAAFAVSTRA